MKLKVIQLGVGKYNVFSTEESLSFSMGIYGDDNKIVQDEKGIKAILYYSGETDEKEDFEDAVEQIGEVYIKCAKYADRVFGTTDYKAQCLLFAKIYQENLQQIEENLVEDRKNEYLKEIKSLEDKVQRLRRFGILRDISWEVNSEIDKKINMKKNWLADIEKKNLDLKEDSLTYRENVLKIEKYSEDIKDLESRKVDEVADFV